MLWDSNFLIFACLILQLNNTPTVQQLLANVHYLGSQRILSPQLAQRGTCSHNKSICVSYHIHWTPIIKLPCFTATSSKSG